MQHSDVQRVELLVCIQGDVSSTQSIGALDHSYNSAVIQAQSCGNAEITRYTCARGDNSYDVTTKSRIGHSWVSIGFGVDITGNSKKKYYRYYCSRCGQQFQTGIASQTPQSYYGH